MTERKGASYKITQKHAAQDPNGPSQPTQATANRMGTGKKSMAGVRSTTGRGSESLADTVERIAGTRR